MKSGPVNTTPATGCSAKQRVAKDSNSPPTTGSVSEAALGVVG